MKLLSLVMVKVHAILMMELVNVRVIMREMIATNVKLISLEMIA